MKMNAFLRLIRTIACGVVVLGASNTLAQQNVDSLVDQIYYPPGMEMPLTETEIPGSSYYVGPDGERIDGSTMMHQVPAGQEMEIPGEGSLEGLTPGQTFSPEGVYDGTLSFPMGTFPTTPFGERIISEEPAGESTAEKYEPGEIKGALLDENGRPIGVAAGDDATPAMENGVPVDQIIRPDNSPTPEEMTDAAGDEGSTSRSLLEAAVADAKALGEPKAVLKPNESGGIQGLKDEVKIFMDPDTGQVTLIGDGEDTALVAKSLEDLAKQDPKAAEKNLEKKIAERQNRLKKRLKDALGEKERLSGLLRKANQKTEDLTKEVGKLKDAGKKEGKSRSQLARLTKDLKKAKSDASKSGKKLKEMESKLKEAESRYKETAKAMKDAEKKIEMMQANLTKSEKMLQATVESAEEKEKELIAKMRMLQNEAAATEAKIATGEAKTKADATAALAAQASAEMAKKAKEAKAAAELEVSMKLKEMEERKKVADAAKAAAEDAAGDKAETAEGEDGEEPVLSLDDQIKRLKAKRDQQIAESETRIRAKRQREIDKLLEEGKAVDSDEVKAAVDKMKGAIKTSEEKLRSRFLRRLERLKEDMKNSLK